MQYKFPSWITKQMILGARGFNLDAYLMALEGWRRGLKLTWYLDPKKKSDLKIIGFNPLGKFFSLENKENEKTHYFYRSRGDLVANEAVDLVHNKYYTKQKLQKASVPTPKGFVFEKTDDLQSIINKLRDSNFTYPVVVKPLYGSLGKGVITDITNEKQLKEALQKTKENKEYKEFMIEQYKPGSEYRIYVVGDQVAAATKRIPANVVGNGVHSISELIEIKNESRKQNPYLRSKLITIDEDIKRYLERNNRSIEGIPSKNEFVQLKGQSNVSAGGDPIDATDSISDKIKNVAINATKAVPNLVHVGIDVIVTESGDPYIIEMNSTADICMHVFPSSGEYRNVPGKIIDYYFPETKGLEKGKDFLYFNYRDIRPILRDSLAQEVTLADVPKGTMFKRRYIVKGKVQKVGYRNWIRRQAVKQGLHGYTRNLNNGNVVVVVAGDSKEKLEKFKNICLQGPKRAEVSEVKTLQWDRPIKIGFEIRKSR